jgi:hypothetical protein
VKSMLPGQGSNLRMAESKSAALPLGYRASCLHDGCLISEMLHKNQSLPNDRDPLDCATVE